jgi:osmotically-inducible protein OsmY
MERNDGDIFGEARTALDRRLDIPSTVHVHVAGGVATLTGTVHVPGEQLLAKETVRRVRGVRRVINWMTLAHAINPKGLEPPDTR